VDLKTCHRQNAAAYFSAMLVTKKNNVLMPLTPGPKTVRTKRPTIEEKDASVCHAGSWAWSQIYKKINPHKHWTKIS
jgi:hypothetical protein